MSDKPKRSWFQFRLVTAVLLMFLAAGLTYLNMREKEEESPFTSRWNFTISYGWPMTYRCDYYMIEKSEKKLLGVDWFRTGCALDVTGALAIVTTGLISCEAIIRRREARKT
jgi:hypothetical protein